MRECRPVRLSPVTKAWGAADNTQELIFTERQCLECTPARVESSRLTTKLSDGAPTARPASGRSALAQKVMVRARAPALYGSGYEHFMHLAARCSAELGGAALVAML
jgi:hypothetical protein